MKVFFEDEQTAVPPEAGDQEADHGAFVYRLRTCVTFAVLALSLDQFIAMHHGAVAGSPPRLDFGRGLIWEFEEQLDDTGTEEVVLYIKRVEHAP